MTLLKGVFKVVWTALSCMHQMVALWQRRASYATVSCVLCLPQAWSSLIVCADASRRKWNGGAVPRSALRICWA